MSLMNIKKLTVRVELKGTSIAVFFFNADELKQKCHFPETQNTFGILGACIGFFSVNIRKRCLKKKTKQFQFHGKNKFFRKTLIALAAPPSPPPVSEVICSSHFSSSWRGIP